MIANEAGEDRLPIHRLRMTTIIFEDPRFCLCRKARPQAIFLDGPSGSAYILDGSKARPLVSRAQTIRSSRLATWLLATSGALPSFNFLW